MLAGRRRGSRPSRRRNDDRSWASSRLLSASSNRWHFEQPHEYVPLLILALVQAPKRAARWSPVTCRSAVPHAPDAGCVWNCGYGEAARRGRPSHRLRMTPPIMSAAASAERPTTPTHSDQSAITATRRARPRIGPERMRRGSPAGRFCHPPRAVVAFGNRRAMRRRQRLWPQAASPAAARQPGGWPPVPPPTG